MQSLNILVKIASSFNTINLITMSQAENKKLEASNENIDNISEKKGRLKTFTLEEIAAED